MFIFYDIYFSSDSIVKATLYISGKKHKRRKTSAASRQRGDQSTATSHPVWNEALVFSGLSRDQLMTCVQLELVVTAGGWGGVGGGGGGDHDPIGRVSIGADSIPGRPEYTHWHEMLNGRPAIAKWHELTPLITI